MIQLLADKTPADSTPAWAGLAAGLVAIAVFVAFSTFIVVQRVRSHRRERSRG